MNRFFHILFSFFLLLLIVTCAKIGSPTGGPKDETPPLVEKSKPLNRSVRYEDQKIEITFDEFIRSEAIAQELVVSPPLEERPEIRMRGKTLVIEWQEPLRDSTTYTFSFGESIKDLNEGNVLRNYEFVFSTGEHQDSLAVLGTVLQAFNLQPHKENVFLMLYSNLSDSAPLLEIPEYVGKADPRGNFLINNVRQGDYRLFALQDLNRNYKYDVPEEYIGYLDSVIRLSPDIFTRLEKGDSIAHPLSDSLPASAEDSVFFNGLRIPPSGDSLILSLQDTSGFGMPDSVLIGEKDSLTLADLAPWSIFVDMFIFQEDRAPQYLIDNTRKDRRMLRMRFNRRVTDTVILEPVDFEPSGDWYVFEQHILNDTFDYWIADSMIYRKDSLLILATYPVTDSLLNYIPFHDTLRFNYREPSKQAGRRRKEKDEDAGKQDVLSVSVILSGGQEQDPFNPLALEMQRPLASVDTSRISLVRFKDTLMLPVTYALARDDVRLRRYSLNTQWEGPSAYKLTLYPGAFTDIYGTTNDTIAKQFRVRNPEYYGNLLLSLEGTQGPIVLQILDSKGSLIRQRTILQDGLAELSNLPPGTYSLKVIRDQNANGKWDTGNYLERRQPEPVAFYPGSLTIRSNFDLEINWDLEAGADQ